MGCVGLGDEVVVMMIGVVIGKDDDKIFDLVGSEILVFLHSTLWNMYNLIVNHLVDINLIINRSKETTLYRILGSYCLQGEI